MTQAWRCLSGEYTGAIISCTATSCCLAADDRSVISWSFQYYPNTSAAFPLRPLVLAGKCLLQTCFISLGCLSLVWSSCFTGLRYWCEALLRASLSQMCCANQQVKRHKIMFWINNVFVCMCFSNVCECARVSVCVLLKCQSILIHISLVFFFLSFMFTAGF